MTPRLLLEKPIHPETDSSLTDGMTARFFGAGPGSARRRRRLMLASETSFDPGAPSRPKLAAVPHDQIDEPLERTRVVTRLNSLIRPEPWLNWTITAGMLALWAVVVGWGASLDVQSRGIQDILGLRAGWVCRLLAATALLGVSQLSLIILWYRTRSRKDFQGRYRTWIWSTAAWSLFFSATLFGWHRGMSQILTARLPGRLERVSELFWLLPSIAVFVATCRMLLDEMSRTRTHRWLLRSAMLAAGGWAVLQLNQGLIQVPAELEVRVACGALWPVLLAATLLHHAAYVIHVTNEVAPARARHRVFRR